MFQEAQNKGFGPDEQEFSDVITAEKSKFFGKDGTDKIPEQVWRKPRFFNSVKQGYEWNKYN